MEGRGRLKAEELPAEPVEVERCCDCSAVNDIGTEHRARPAPKEKKKKKKKSLRGCPGGGRLNGDGDDDGSQVARRPEKDPFAEMSTGFVDPRVQPAPQAAAPAQEFNNLGGHLTTPSPIWAEVGIPLPTWRRGAPPTPLQPKWVPCGSFAAAPATSSSRHAPATTASNDPFASMGTGGGDPFLPGAGGGAPTWEAPSS